MGLSNSPGVCRQAITTVLAQHNIQKGYCSVCHTLKRHGSDYS
jgi:hypothetical protein